MAKFLAALLTLVLTQSAYAGDIWVTDLVDDLNFSNGTCTLREAIESSNQNMGVDACEWVSGPDKIYFSKTGTISLITSLPSISSGLEIVGPGKTLLILDGNGSGALISIAEISMFSSVSISGLSITNGFRGVSIANSSSNSMVTIRDCDIYGHSGGGIFAGNSRLTIRRSTIRDNVTSDEGGGIEAGGSGGFLHLYRSSILANEAGEKGGGIYLTGTGLIESSTISGNTAEEGGGGISFSGSLDIKNSTITENQVLPSLGSGNGGGIEFFVNGTLNIKNSILSENIDLLSFDGIHHNFYNSGNGVVDSSSEFNLIGVLNASQAVSPFNFGEPNSKDNWIGSFSTPLFALLDPLADNGGPTLTHSMQSQFSLPVDQGDCLEESLDQRGYLRGEKQSLVPGPCDIGAYEFDAESSERYVQLNVLLDGAFDGTEMRNDLQINNRLDEQPPYSGSPWNHSGNEEIALPFPIDIVDWVLLEFSKGSPDDPGGLLSVASRAFLLTQDGQLVTPALEYDPILFNPGNYWITVYHRNHLSVTTKTPLLVDWQDITYYDFTSDGESAYTSGGVAQRLTPSGLHTMWGGDGNSNGSVSAFDFLDVWLPNNGEPSGYVIAADFDMNGSITAFDFLNVWLVANGQASQTP